MIGNKVSVVTVVYNGESLIEETIASVLRQTHRQIEYIIVDGASQDQTLAVVRSYGDRIQKVLSEPDQGIYDAMNKGIDLATGDWIIFMNAGDRFSSNIVVEEIFGAGPFDEDIVYGDAVVQYPDFTAPFRMHPLHQMWRRTCFCHQASFSRATLLKNTKFDTKFKIGADFDFFFRTYRDGGKFKYIPKVIALFDGRAGTTKHNILRSYIDREKSSLTHQPSVLHFLYFKIERMYVTLNVLVKQLLGKRMTNFLTRLARA